MNNKVDRILLLLASSDISIAAFSDFADWIRDVGPEGFQDAVRALRLSAEKETSGRPTPDQSLSIREILNRMEAKSARHSVPQRVEDLLRKQASLPANSASQLLLEAISKTINVSPASLPKLNKEKFSIWIEKLSRLVPEHVLLREATRIRDRLAKKSGSHWPLRSRKD